MDVERIRTLKQQDEEHEAQLAERRKAREAAATTTAAAASEVSGARQARLDKVHVCTKHDEFHTKTADAVLKTMDFILKKTNLAALGGEGGRERGDP